MGKIEINTLVRSSPTPRVSLAIRDAWNRCHKVGDKIIFINKEAKPELTTITGPCAVRVIAVKEGWVQYDMEYIPRQTLREDLFLKFYEKVETL